MEVIKILETIINERKNEDGIQNVVWVAAGGSNGGFYPAQYFMDHESKTIRSQSFTSNEFVLSTPAFVGEHTLAVICSMRGTPETIEAARVAKERGAVTIGLYIDESELTEICDYRIKYESIAIDESHMDKINSAIGLKIAMTLTHLCEGYDGYDAAIKVFDKIDPLYRDAVKYTTPLAKHWALQNKDSKCIYVMGSGPAYGAAYIFSICNIMEMLQIDSPTVNCCEFFHGPFETLHKDLSVFLLISEGRCHEADIRAMKFLDQYGGRLVYKLDAKEIGVSYIDDSVREYFNHLLFSPILNNVYMRELSYVTGKDYNSRTYMWKVEY